MQAHTDECTDEHTEAQVHKHIDKLTLENVSLSLKHFPFDLQKTIPGTWRIPDIPAIGRLRWEGYKLETSLGYMARPCP